ncbi:type I polyketide synthase [Umezakia ovalisporum]|uniref:type I polyketide synthase n=1 Tax=Umezakia ovalisporum TaxID=75695 RepID=UPI00247647A2|nr:type I polyketide synthase [Umezakia ovalisporum]MDH6066279.1 type I polyketide synthase [Umezakia ovalisporum APH033B]MDH6103492.1 type I polyketide synthase [Umezakia ovalisporum ANA283AFssAo]
MEELTQNKIPKIAIVGMDCYLGGNCQGLDIFEQSVYEGIQHFVPLPEQRWQGLEKQEQLLKQYGFTSGKPPLGAYIKDFEIDALRWQTVPEKVDKFNAQELLMLQVADHALQDAGLHPGSRIGVVIVSSTELTLSENTSLEYPQIEKELANYVSQMWNFAGPALTLTAEQNSVFKALELAQKLLAMKEVDAVLVGAVDLAGDSASVLLRNQIAAINTGVNTLSYDEQANGWMVGEGAAAIVLKLHETAIQHNIRIYAVIDALSLVENVISQIHSIPTAIDAKAITQVCERAFQLANIKPTDVNYLEVIGSGIPSQDESEIQGLLQAYGTYKANLNCALGSAKANFGHTYAVSGLVSLIKTALCLYRRYIPVVPQWSSPKMPEIWQDSPFYVAAQSKPWILEQGVTKRIAAVNGMEVDGSYAHLILSEELGQEKHSHRYLEEIPYYLFAIAGDDYSSLLEQIDILQETIVNCSSLAAAASQTFKTFQKYQQATYTLSILARNQDELMREIHRSMEGVKIAFETGKDWQTPLGSYFTAKPLGKQHQVAFVYPGSFNSHIGIARNLFRVFPQIYDDLAIRSVYNRVAKIEKILYPRSLKKLSTKQLEALEYKLINDPLTMLEAEVGIAGFMTAILRDYFQVKPKCAFGYSLGEISMMFAQGVWTAFKQSSEGLNSSPLFKTRLSGPKNAVREYWGLPTQDHDDKNFWGNYVVICPLSQVREALKQEKRVYITLINTPEEIVIVGDTQACQRVIESLNCHAYHTPINHVIHCDPMRSEYEELVKINTLPVQDIRETVFYSAAEYKPITLDSSSIGHNIAQALSQELDFPKLVKNVYNDGFRIFIEVGVGGNCSRWIGKILEDKEHIAISLNRRGVDDHTSIIKALAKLLSHRVEIDLSLLYSPCPPNFIPNQLAIETITLGSRKPNHISLTENQQEIFTNKFSTQHQSELLEANEYAKPIYAVNLNLTTTGNKGMMNNLIAKTTNKTSTFLVSDRPTYITEGQSPDQEDCQSILDSDCITDRHIGKNQLPNLRHPQYQKLSHNLVRMTETHASLLELRQQSLHQISAIIQQQLELYQNLLKEVNP